MARQNALYWLNVHVEGGLGAAGYTLERQALEPVLVTSSEHEGMSDRHSYIIWDASKYRVNSDEAFPTIQAYPLKQSSSAADLYS